MLELKPVISRDSFRAHASTRVIPVEYLKNRPLVLQRDNFTCQGCAFSVTSSGHFESRVSPASDEYSKYLTIHNINGDHEDNKLSNLATVCPFCHNVFHYGCAGDLADSKLIFYPWLSQAEINLMTNLLISCQVNPSSPYIETASILFDHLDSHSIYAESRRMFEQGMSDTGPVVSALLSVIQKNNEAIPRTEELLAGLRVFPVAATFSKAAKVWNGEWISEDEWSRIGELWDEQTI